MFYGFKDILKGLQQEVQYAIKLKPAGSSCFAYPFSCY